MSGWFSDLDGSEDELDGDVGDSQPQSPCTFNVAFQEQDGAASATDSEAVAAEYLRVIGDRLQAEYGNQLDMLMNGLDWTLPRDALLADVRRVVADILSRISDVWTQVGY